MCDIQRFSSSLKAPPRLGNLEEPPADTAGLHRWSGVTLERELTHSPTSNQGSSQLGETASLLSFSSSAWVGIGSDNGCNPPTCQRLTHRRKNSCS